MQPSQNFVKIGFRDYNRIGVTILKIPKSCYAITGIYFLPPWGVNSGFIVGNSFFIDKGIEVYGHSQIIRGEKEIDDLVHEFNSVLERLRIIMAFILCL